ncbi:MAG: TylF/MycF/NovP-related O-methyltransferase [Verrucomicrobiota bacterium]|nr:TylF/MycF/NovP-related O-methyltransferase [Verrucomicrobiota bacterium]
MKPSEKHKTLQRPTFLNTALLYLTAFLLKLSAKFKSYITTDSSSAAANRFTRKTGLVVFEYNKAYAYAPSYYSGSHWKKTDIASVDVFGPLAAKVIGDGKTYLREDRLYVLYQALTNIRRLGVPDACIAEIGVYRGGSSYFLGAATTQLFPTPPAVYSFDTFEGHPDDLVAAVDGEHRPGQFSDTSFEEVSRYVSPFKHLSVHQGRFQDNVQVLAGKKLSLVHIDVDIYLATQHALEFVFPRLVQGGVIVVDDYGFTSCLGSKKAVDDFVESAKDSVHLLHLTTGQAMLVRLK